ncbi:hypothetical protein DMA11_14400 [Marinilabiliaceae bacterium JC017]|nr:hypothetical protein DMA11_14400 [Marinilabiliaceae bacterium JC017]
MSKLDDIFAKIEKATTDLTTLKIQTVMGDLELQNDGHIGFKKGQTIQGVISNIDLIDGDIKTQITEEFYKNYPELVQFHQAREVKGHEIIANNIDTLKTIIETIKNLPQSK